MFETSTDGVVELNVRAKKYAVVPPAYKPKAWNKTKVDKTIWDECHAILADMPNMLAYWKNQYELAE